MRSMDANRIEIKINVNVATLRSRYLLINFIQTDVSLRNDVFLFTRERDDFDFEIQCLSNEIRYIDGSR